MITGAASRTMPMASTAPTIAEAPICTARPPTSSTSTRPNGIAIRTAGRTVTEIKNHVCSTNSAHENRRWTMADTVDQTASSSIAKRSPTIPRAETTLRPAVPRYSWPQSIATGVASSRRVLFPRLLLVSLGVGVSRSVTDRHPGSENVSGRMEHLVASARNFVSVTSESPKLASLLKERRVRRRCAVRTTRSRDSQKRRVDRVDARYRRRTPRERGPSCCEIPLLRCPTQ